MPSFVPYSLLLITCWLGLNRAAAQSTDTTQGKQPSSSTRIDFVTRMQALAKASAQESAEEFQADKVGINQDRTLEIVKNTAQKAGFYLKNGIDTAGFRAEMSSIDTALAIAGDGVLTLPGGQQSFRNLTATSIIVKELLSRAASHKQRLELHQQRLTNFKYQLDSLFSVPDLFVFPTDSAVLLKYLQKISVLGDEAKPVDSALTTANSNVRTLLNQANSQVFKLQTAQEQLALHQRNVANKIYQQEVPNLWDPTTYAQQFSATLRQAWEKGQLTLLIYTQNNRSKIFVLFLSTLLCFVFIRSVKNIYAENKLLASDFSNQLILKKPLFSAILIIFNVFQFIFPAPPFIFSALLVLVACAVLTILFWGFITSYWMGIWLLMVLLFGLGAANNLLLQASYSERWLMLGLSLAGAGAGVFVVFNGRRAELREHLIYYSIALMAGLELCSVLANVFGRYNLAKSLLIAGFQNVCITILFLWTIRITNEGLNLAFDVYQKQDKKLFFLNFQKVGQRLPKIFYVFLIIGWIVLVGRNFPGFMYIDAPLRELLNQERIIGNYTFTIFNLILFLGILVISVLVAKVVSFFGSDINAMTDHGHSSTQGLGSWMLIIRIGILAIGLFLAFSAAGIPLDKIALILGALGVGIGFGLQTLVNNLVSGLIIAFEKPVNVGDIIEVNGKSGRVKSIGFRSSIVSSWDGADVVIPNGDVLNSQLVNWSLGGNRRRLPLVVSVAYGTDLELAKSLIAAQLREHPQVFKSPAPVILFDDFSHSAIDIRIYFWTRPTIESYLTKSDLIAAIHTSFRENGVVIPFPQQDVHLYAVDELLNKPKASPINATDH